jgi:hypothetical protein
LINHISRTDGKFKLEPMGQEQITRSLLFDNVVVCAGSIESFNLLNRSELIPRVPTLSYFDHPTLELGSISTRKKILVKKVFRNERVFFGRRPGATLINTNSGYRLTIRARPVLIRSNSSIGENNERDFALLKRVIKHFTPIFCDELRISITFDFEIDQLIATNSLNGDIVSFRYRNNSIPITADTFSFLDSLIYENFGEFKKSWNSFGALRESAAAHEMGFLGNLKSGGSGEHAVIENFALKDNPAILVPGAISFPESVPGHPTYLALLTVSYAVTKLSEPSPYRNRMNKL